MTAWQGRCMEAIKPCTTHCGMFCHSSCSAVRSCRSVWGGRFLQYTDWFSASNRCFIGFKSGENQTHLRAKQSSTWHMSISPSADTPADALLSDWGQNTTLHWSSRRHPCLPQPITNCPVEILRSPGICVTVIQFEMCAPGCIDLGWQWLLCDDLILWCHTILIKQRWSVWRHQSALPQLDELPLLVCTELMSIVALLCCYVVCLNHCWWRFGMQSYWISWCMCFSRVAFQYKGLLNISVFTGSMLSHL